MGSDRVPTGLLLAAGGSSRLGRSKQLLEFRGRPLVYHAARLLLESTGDTLVVTGARAGEVGAALAGLDVRVHHNPLWREGVGSSIARGVGALSPDTAAVLLMLCDQYRLDRADLERLRSEWQADPGRIVAAKWEGSFGPPVVFPRRYFGALRALSGDLGARRLLVEQRTRVRFVDTPNAAFDVDEPADVDRLRAHEQAWGPVTVD